MIRLRRGRGQRLVSTVLGVLVIVGGIFLVREVIHRYYGPLVETVRSPETAPLDTP